MQFWSLSLVMRFTLWLPLGYGGSIPLGYGGSIPLYWGPGGGGVNVFSWIFESQIALWTVFEILPLTPLTCPSGIHPWPLSQWSLGDWPPWTGGMGVVGVIDCSSIFILRPLSETVFSIYPPNPLPCMSSIHPYPISVWALGVWTPLSGCRCWVLFYTYFDWKI